MVGIVFKYRHRSRIPVLIVSIFVEFWNAHIEASSVPQSESRIPDVPNIARFLERWFEWHRGYRIINEDGREEHQALLGENLADIPPGYLPRSLNEPRESVIREGSESRPENLGPTEPLNENSFDIDPEDRLFDLNTSSNNINQPTVSSTHLPIQPSTATYQPPSVPPPTSSERAPDPERVARNTQDNHTTTVHDQVRRVAALRREVGRLRAGIERIMSGLQELVPDSQNQLQHTLQHSTNLARTIEHFLTTPDDGAGDVITMDHILNSDSMDWAADGRPATGPQSTAGPQLQTDSNGHVSSGTTSSIFSVGGSSYRNPGWPPRQLTQESSNQPSQSTLNVFQRQLLEARTQLDNARTNEEYRRYLVGTTTTNQEQVQTALRRAIEQREQCERAVTHLELSQRQNANIFGSREEIERQGNSYESPITHLFNQYGNRYQAAEEQRRQERTLQDRMARYVEQSAQVSTDTNSAQVRTVEDVRQELQRESHGSHQSRNHQSREYLSSRRQHQTPGVHQTVPPQAPRAQILGGYQTPYLSAYLRNNTAGSGQGQNLAAFRESLTAVEASALASRTQARRTATHRETRARTDGGQHNTPDLPRPANGRHIPAPPPPPELQYEAAARLLQQQESAMAAFPGRAAAMERRLRQRREELDGSDEDDLSRSDIDRYIATGVFRRQPEREPLKSLDKNDGRPEPLSEDEMMVKMECKICFAQIATVALLPCGKCFRSRLAPSQYRSLKI